MEFKKNTDFDIGRNSSLYFSVGLVLMLFMTYNLLEYKTYDKQDLTIDVLDVDLELEDDIPLVNVETPPPPPPPSAAPEIIMIVEDVVEVEETIIESTESDQESEIEPTVEIADLKVAEIEEDIEVPFAAVESPPVYPGCQGLVKDELKKCFQDKIQEHVAKNFKYPEMAIDRGLHGKVFVLFIIDVDGNTANIKTRGPDKLLENEAGRIISSLPTMIPGKQRGRPVKVAYALPIHFRLENM